MVVSKLTKERSQDNITKPVVVEWNMVVKGRWTNIIFFS